MTNQKETRRYSDAELEEFRLLIESKLAKAREQLGMLREQIVEITENSSDEHGGDWMDDSTTNNDVEMLNNMAIRQRRHIQDLENALVRIRNKTYGICVLTGELIDKKRLMAVPTTTKTLQAKNMEQQGAGPQKTAEDEEEQQQKTPRKDKKAASRVITRVIRKSAGGKQAAAPPLPEEEEEDEELLYNDDEQLISGPAYLDELAEGSEEDSDD